MKESEQIRNRFGGKLREIRERRGMTMKALGEKAGVSESLISQIERARVSPSLDTLITLTDVLEIDLDYLFRELKKKGSAVLVRRGERNSHTADGVLYEHLSRIPDPEGRQLIDALLLTVPPGGKKGSGEYGHIGSELGFVLKGRGELEYGTKTYILEEGDSISFASEIPHTLYNRGKGPLEALWVITPPRR